MRKKTLAHSIYLRDAITRTCVVQTTSLADEDLDSITKCLPTRDQCDLLFQSFLTNVDPVFSICHVPTLEFEFSNFWIDFPNSVSVDFLIYILSVLYSGCVCHPCAQDPETSTSIFVVYQRLLHLLDFPANIASTIHLLQGYLIFNTCRASQMDHLSSYGFLPQAIRVAQSLSLHVDGGTSLVGDEVKRRIWWHLVFLDVQASIASGLPCIIHQDDYTTQMPSNVWDSDISGQHNESQFETPQRTPPMMLAMGGRFEWASKMQTWIKGAPMDEEILDFERFVESTLEQIPENTGNEWARTYLKLQIDQASCLMGFRKGSAVKTLDCHGGTVR